MTRYRSLALAFGALTTCLATTAVRGQSGSVHGVEAVIDKDLTAALLARSVGADVLVIATDVAHAVVGYGTPGARELRRVTLEQLQSYAAEGHFAAGSMGPKVEAAMRFVRAGGRRSIITALDQITDAVDHGVGTVIENPTPANDYER